MVDANIPDIALEPDKTVKKVSLLVALTKQEKLAAALQSFVFIFLFYNVV